MTHNSQRIELAQEYEFENVVYIYKMEKENILVTFLFLERDTIITATYRRKGLQEITVSEGDSMTNMVVNMTAGSQA